MRHRPDALVTLPTWWWRAAILPAVLVVFAMATGCTSHNDIQYRRTSVPTPESQPGSLVSAQPFPDVDPAIANLHATATKVVYRSTGHDGSPTEVSGAIFTPTGKPPIGGWPVVAIAHAGVGMAAECAPSSSRDLAGEVDMIVDYLKVGWAVTVADYQGLGQTGKAHPYLDSRTAAFNIIDSVRALRVVSPQVATTWTVVGRSEGGSAAWATNEQASTYGKELNLVGAVAFAPLPDFTPLARRAADRSLSREQIDVYLRALMGLADTRTDFALDEYRHGAATEHWDQLRACLHPASDDRAAAISAVTAEDLTPADDGAIERLTQIFQDMALPQQRGAAPLLVIYGGRDSVVDSEWTRDAIARSCAFGTKVSVVFQPDRGHDDINVDEFWGWLVSRMDGLPPPDNC